MTDLRIDISDGVLEVVLDRPPVNALDLGLQQQLIDAFEGIAARDDVSVVVLRGSGRGFCGGVDVNTFVAPLSRDERSVRDELMLRVYTSLYELPLPTICAIHGFGVGAGVVMGVMCDFRLMADDAFLLMPEIDRGTVAGGGAFFHRLRLHPADIRRVLLLGERISAAEAYRMRLVDELAPSAELDARVADLADRLNRKSRTALRLSKEAGILAEGQADWRQGYRATFDLNAELRRTAAAGEGVAAFLEKRPHAYED